MARSISQISNALTQALVAQAATLGIVIIPTNWSKYDIKRLFINIFSTGLNIFEQLFDNFKIDILETANRIPPQTYLWFQYLMINVFEYDATAVPIVQLDTTTFVPYYPNPNSNFNIVKYCSVKKGAQGTTIVKIAGVGPSKILAAPLAAAQSFIDTIGVPGITYIVSSDEADRLFLQLDVYYNGRYAAVIQNNVIAAIDSFLADLSTNNFNGTMILSLLEQAILSVEGVNDVVVINAQARANSTNVGSGTNLVLNKLEIERKWDTVAGYIIKEDTTGGNWRLTDYRVGSSGDLNLKLIAN